jgi:hypothetical protein
MTLCLALGELLCGWLIADLIGGLFHWWEDRVGRETTPFFGPAVVVWNRIHHRNPSASLQGGFWYRNRDPIIAAIVVAVAWYFAFGLSLVWFSVTLGLAVSTQVHYFAHHPTDNRVIRVLQDIGIFQHPKHHSRHHSRKQDTRYCVLTNYINPVLDQLKIWHLIEDGLTAIGLPPNKGTA